MNYFSIDDIFVEETKLKVKFEHKIEKFGFYSSESQEDIPENKKVELPYFLIKFLLENRHCELVDDLIPKDIRHELKACSSIVNLSQIYKFFYLFLTNFEDKNFVKEILIERLSRFTKMIIKENLDEDDIHFMDQSERSIILNGRESYLAYKRYYTQ